MALKGAAKQRARVIVSAGRKANEAYKAAQSSGNSSGVSNVVSKYANTLGVSSSSSAYKSAINKVGGISNKGISDFGDVDKTNELGQTKSGYRTTQGLLTKPQYTDLGGLDKYGAEAMDMEAKNKGSIAKRNDLLLGNLVSEGITDEAGVKKFFESKAGFTEASPEDQANTISAMMARIGEQPATLEEPETEAPAEMLANYGDEALRQAEYYTEVKQQEDFLRQQRADTIKITDAQGNVLEIQRSQRLREMEDQVNDLKQQTAYLGSRGQPGVSSVQLDAMGKQIGEAEQLYREGKQIESTVAQIRERGLEMDTNQFEEQMRRIQVDLDNKVNQSIQDILDQVTVAEMAGEYDTIEEVNALRDSLFFNLDKVIAGEIVGNQRDRQLVIDQYQNALAKAQQTITNKNTVNTEMSALKGYAIDMNGDAIIGDNGKPIQMPKEAPMPPVYDKDTGILITFSYDEYGNIKGTPTQVLNGGNARDVSKAQKIMESDILEDNEKQLLLEELGRDNIGGDSSGPSGYTAVNDETLDYFVNDLLNGAGYNEGTVLERGECGEFVNDGLRKMGVQMPGDPNLITNTREEKQNIINSDTPKVGSVAVIKSSTHPEYGHVGFVTGINEDGSINIKESNWNGDHTIHDRNKENGLAMQPSDIEGYFDPTIAPESDTEDINLDKIYGLIAEGSIKYSDITKKLKSMGMKGETKTNIANSISEGMVNKYLKQDATSDDINGMWVQLDDIFDGMLTRKVFYDLISGLDNAIPYVINNLDSSMSYEEMADELRMVVDDTTSEDYIKSLLEARDFSKRDRRKIYNAL